MQTEVITPPTDGDYETFYPIAQIRKDLVVASTTYDDRLKRMLRAAVHVCGQTARIIILPTTLRVRFDAPTYKTDCFGVLGKMIDKDFTMNGLYLKGPVVSITSLSDGVTALTENTDFEVVRDENTKGLGRIAWMEAGEPVRERVADKRLTCTYIAGFSTTNPDRPTIVQAVFEVMAHYWTTPGEINDYAALAIPQSALQILQGFWTSRINRRHH